jgi:uncharacterized membrane protein
MSEAILTAFDPWRRAVREAMALAVLSADAFVRRLFVIAGILHLAFGVAGVLAPRWFFATVPPWPPLHVGQIQIAGIFDLSLATGFLVASHDVARYADVMLAVGVVAEWGHASVRIGHMLVGDNPTADWLGPAGMLVIGALLAIAGIGRRAAITRASAP